MSKYHSLDFLLDDEDSCALTVHSEDCKRLHIIADAGNLRKSTKPAARATWNEYAKLVDAARGKPTESDEHARSEPDSALGLSPSEEKKSWQRPANPDEAEEALQSWMLGPIRSKFPLGPEPSPSTELPTLHDWYNAETHFYNLDISNSGELQATALEPASDLKRRTAKLIPEVTLPKYIRDIGLPWYRAESLDVLASSESPPPWHPTCVKVQETGQRLFFKAVQGDAPQSTKRELSLLHKLNKPGLHDKIRVPELKGLVSLGNSQTRALGFLQSEIANPVPLTAKLDSEVPQEDRDRWADEVERMIAVLHDHGIVWGDAKGDNILVDQNNALWLIDLGGSYTEGWVDPELKDTEEGDEQGTEKIVNALHDPVANTVDPEEEDAKDGSSASSTRGLKRGASDSVTDDDSSQRKQQKRAGSASHPEVRVPFSEVEDVEDGEEKPGEERKAVEKENEGIENEDTEEAHDEVEASHRKDTDSEAYCYCYSPSAGRMIGCDGARCKRLWFHVDCIGEKEPPEDSPWFCKECR